ncbi:PREDICTED: CDGSH iron-sulfur domain-containing protein 2 [Chaetura pelagica]|uniref:CDGSH iron-sulfur domain-containing protein 2 n=1 Tax=Chaetura pelagica TaxID=8897 RepID=UPI0005233993|nr:PREDICTED: CDGSH iron-sulfur domain-containing protein 2 [Chaetura pelagica]
MTHVNWYLCKQERCSENSSSLQHVQTVQQCVLSGALIKGSTVGLRSTSKTSAVLPASQLASREGWKSRRKQVVGRTEALDFRVESFDSELEDKPHLPPSVRLPDTICDVNPPSPRGAAAAPGKPGENPHGERRPAFRFGTFHPAGTKRALPAAGVTHAQPGNQSQFHLSLVSEWLRLLPFLGVLALLGYLAVRPFLSKKKQQKDSLINLKIQKENPKVVNEINIEDLCLTKAYCRCWRSKTFPVCDGSHNKHNELTGDNVGPLILKKKEV